MFHSIRSALLVVATISATSVAPAKAGQNAEPLLPVASPSVPQVVTVQPVVIETAPVEHIQPVADGIVAESDEQTSRLDVRPSGNLQSMVAQLRGSNPGSREMECLAVGIYFESKGEPLAGQLAVGKVIANRANSKGRFPGSYCGVLFQRSQFSFIRGRSLPSAPRSSRPWQTAVAIAKIVDQGLHSSSVGSALFFHARHVAPRWHLTRVASVGNHIFYR
ncbi:MAG: cell wall hydrolase [Sphingomicrobium sp.]